MAILMSMGYSEYVSNLALEKCSDPNMAVVWLLENGESAERKREEQREYLVHLILTISIDFLCFLLGKSIAVAAEEQFKESGTVPILTLSPAESQQEEWCVFHCGRWLRACNGCSLT